MLCLLIFGYVRYLTVNKGFLPCVLVTLCALRFSKIINSINNIDEHEIRGGASPTRVRIPPSLPIINKLALLINSFYFNPLESIPIYKWP